MNFSIVWVFRFIFFLGDDWDRKNVVKMKLATQFFEALRLQLKQWRLFAFLPCQNITQNYLQSLIPFLVADW